MYMYLLHVKERFQIHVHDVFEYVHDVFEYVHDVSEYVWNRGALEEAMAAPNFMSP